MTADYDMLLDKKQLPPLPKHKKDLEEGRGRWEGGGAFFFWKKKIHYILLFNFVATMMNLLYNKMKNTAYIIITDY